MTTVHETNYPVLPAEPGAAEQAQSGPVFGLSYVVGINLMPRMRNINDLVLYKADRRRKYKHIDSLCRQAIDWALIERHYADMMRVAVSLIGIGDGARPCPCHTTRHAGPHRAVQEVEVMRVEGNRERQSIRP